MDLYLIRHGYAEGFGSGAPSDQERALTDRGRELLIKAGPGMRAARVVPSVVLTSPYLRAHQTAELLAHLLEPKEGVLVIPSLASGASVDGLLEVATDHQSLGSVMIVAHNPEIEAASRLLAARADVRIGPTLPGTLAWFRHAGSPTLQNVQFLGQWDLEAWDAC